MLLQSSSTPILCLPHSSAVADSGHRSNPITVTASSHNRMQRTPSDGNMRQAAIPKKHSPLSSVRSLGAHDSFKEEGTDNISSPTLSLAGGNVVSKGCAAQGFGDYGEGKQMIASYAFFHLVLNPAPTSHVIASYAWYLWNAEEEEEEVKGEEHQINGANTFTPQQPHGRFPHGTPCNFTTAAC